jgi:hypothetical protein
LGENNDISGAAKLLIFIHGNFSVCEELLSISSLLSTAPGEYLAMKVKEAVVSLGLK